MLSHLRELISMNFNLQFMCLHVVLKRAGLKCKT